MQKFYRFLVLLFLSLVITCFLFSLLNTWLALQLFKIPHHSTAPFNLSLSAPAYLKISLIRGITLSLFVFTIIILLFKKAFSLGQKFSLKKILQTLLAFLLITLFISSLLSLWFGSKGYSFSFIKFYLDSPVSLKTPYWLAFPIGWAFLYFFLAAGIKPSSNG